MINAAKKWWSQPISTKLFVGLFCPMFIFYILYLVSCSPMQIDMYFMVASGREILTNGIPYHNVWTIDSDSSIVLQQWSYDVILALLDKVGYLGFLSFVIVELAAFMILSFYFFRQGKNKRLFCTIGIGIALFITQAYTFSIRPELITLLLILIQCIVLDRYRDTGSRKWLAVLPVVMLVEINVHASMWPIHYAVILAYMVPAFYTQSIKSNDVHSMWKGIIAASVCMFGIMFINPYGIDGILYVIRSYIADTFKYVDIQEIMNTEIVSCWGAAIIVVCVLLFLCIKFRVLKSVTINIMLGFLTMAAMSPRNNMFLLIAVLFLWRDLCDADFEVKLDWRKDLKRSIIPVLLAADMFFAGLFGMRCPLFHIDYDRMLTTGVIFDIADYIEQSDVEDPRVFTDMDAGSHLEYKGFKNVYIDSRPEIYTADFTGDNNILADFSRYAVWGFTVPSIRNEKSGITVTDDEMQMWLDSYDFDYLVICSETEPYLAGYMSRNSDYRRVDQFSGRWLLYERVDVL